MKNRPPFDTQAKRDDAHCAGRSGPKTKAKAKAMRTPPFKLHISTKEGMAEFCARISFRTSPIRKSEKEWTAHYMAMPDHELRDIWQSYQC